MNLFGIKCLFYLFYFILFFKKKSAARKITKFAKKFAQAAWRESIFFLYLRVKISRTKGAVFYPFFIFILGAYGGSGA